MNAKGPCKGGCRRLWVREEDVMEKQVWRVDRAGRWGIRGEETMSGREIGSHCVAGFAMIEGTLSGGMVGASRRQKGEENHSPQGTSQRNVGLPPA